MVAYYGIPERLFNIKPLKRPKKFEVCFWGEPKKRRGFDILLLAAKKVLKECPDIQFNLFLKPEWDSPEYYSQSRGFFNLHSKNFNLHTYPNGFDLHQAVANSDIVAMPFLENPMEPPLVLVESMALGKAVITTAVGATPNSLRIISQDY